LSSLHFPAGTEGYDSARSKRTRTPFLNAPVTTDIESCIFGTSDFGGGVGGRLKSKKHSGTNLAVDMDSGAEGSKGVFFGMAEVF
jgi:hypothetical protein